MKNLLLLCMFCLVTLSTANAKATPCGDRLMGFNVYEELGNGSIADRHSLFEIIDWSDASSFEGVVVKKTEGEKLSLQVEVRAKMQGKVLAKKTFRFLPWKRDPNYQAADFEARSFFDKKERKGFFVLRLLKGDQVLCEDAERPILSED